LSRQLMVERDKDKVLLALHEWEGAPWPDELYELSARMPEITRDFRVRVLRGLVEAEKRPSSPGPGGTRPAAVQPGTISLNSRPVGRLDLHFHATSSSSLDRLNTELLASGSKDSQGAYYRPQAHTKRDRATFDKTVYIRKRQPDQYDVKIEL